MSIYLLVYKSKLYSLYLINIWPMLNPATDASMTKLMTKPYILHKFSFSSTSRNLEPSPQVLFSKLGFICCNNFPPIHVVIVYFTETSFISHSQINPQQLCQIINNTSEKVETQFFLRYISYHMNSFFSSDNR